MARTVFVIFIAILIMNHSNAIPQIISSNSVIGNRSNWIGLSTQGVHETTVTTGPNPDTVSKGSVSPKLIFPDGKSKRKVHVHGCAHHCRCQITETFSSIDCSNGKWKTLPSDISPMTQELNMSTNRIASIVAEKMFQMVELTILDLSRNFIRTIPSEVFQNLRSLQQLILSKNQLTNMEPHNFKGLHSLQRLDISENELSSSFPKALSALKKLSELKADRFIFCCNKNLEISDCNTPHETFSSCENLIQYNTLRCVVWVFAILIASANLTALVLRCKKAVDLFQPSSFLPLNLCIADGLLSIYLFTIAVADGFTSGEYYKNDLWWRHSGWCKLAGVVFTSSSEMSVFLLTVMTLERVYSLIRLKADSRCTRSVTYCICAFGWLIAITLAVVPCLRIPYFNGFPGFYSRTGMCLPLHLTQHKVAGWEYSVVLFMGLNGLSLIIVDVGSVVVFYLGRKAIHAYDSQDKLLVEIRLAQRLVCVMLTNAACWTPVIVLTALALAEVDIPLEVYDWAAILVMPINATINPILYTFLSGYIRVRPGTTWWTLTPRAHPRKAAVRRQRCSSIPDKMTTDKLHEEYTTELEGGLAFIEIRRSLAEELDGNTLFTMSDIHTLMMELNQQVRELESEKDYIPKVTLDTVLVEKKQDPSEVGSLEKMSGSENNKPTETVKHFRLKQSCARDDDVMVEPGFAEERMKEVSDLVAFLMAKFGYNK